MPTSRSGCGCGMAPLLVAVIGFTKWGLQQSLEID
jgi:hypothetical protein